MENVDLQSVYMVDKMKVGHKKRSLLVQTKRERMCDPCLCPGSVPCGDGQLLAMVTEYPCSVSAPIVIVILGSTVWPPFWSYHLKPEMLLLMTSPVW